MTRRKSPFSKKELTLGPSRNLLLLCSARPRGLEPVGSLVSHAGQQQHHHHHPLEHLALEFERGLEYPNCALLYGQKRVFLSVLLIGDCSCI